MFDAAMLVVRQVKPDILARLGYLTQFLPQLVGDMTLCDAWSVHTPNQNDG